MKINVIHWGNSLGIRLPKALAKLLGIEGGDEVEMKIEKNRMVLQKSAYDLDELISKITPDNIHKETNWGAPKGKELW